MELLAKAYRGIKRHWILFFSLPLVGAIVGLLIFYSGEDKYDSSMMISTDLISKNEAEFIVKELQAADSVMPGLTPEEAHRLVSLQFVVDSKVENVPLPNGTSFGRDVIFLKITAEVTDPAIYPALEVKLMKYMNSIDPIRQNRKRQEFLNRKIITKIDSELVLLNGIRQHASSQTMAGYNDPASLFSASVDLYEARMLREVRIDEMTSVHLTKGFGSLMKKSRMSRTTTCVLGFVAGLFAFVVIVFVQYFNRYNRALKE